MGAIVATFWEWEHLLNAVEGKVTFFADHKNLLSFNTFKVLTRHQARWSEDFGGINLKVIYRPGEKHGELVVLSSGLDHRLGNGGELEVPHLQRFFRL
jgi:hypothetical protein